MAATSMAESAGGLKVQEVEEYAQNASQLSAAQRALDAEAWPWQLQWLQRSCGGGLEQVPTGATWH